MGASGALRRLLPALERRFVISEEAGMPLGLESVFGVSDHIAGWLDLGMCKNLQLRLEAQPQFWHCSLLALYLGRADIPSQASRSQIQANILVCAALTACT